MCAFFSKLEKASTSSQKFNASNFTIGWLRYAAVFSLARPSVIRPRLVPDPNLGNMMTC